jgi:hypothetical protein
MDNCVFLQTNHKQIVGALVAEYALRRISRQAISLLSLPVPAADGARNIPQKSSAART